MRDYDESELLLTLSCPVDRKSLNTTDGNPRVVILWGIAQIFCGLYILSLASPGPGLIVPAGWSLVFSGACSVYFGSSQGDRQKMAVVVASFLSFLIGTGQLVLIRSHMMSKSAKPFEEMNELITETHLTEVIGFGSSFNAVFLFVALPYLLYE